MCECLLRNSLDAASGLEIYLQHLHIVGTVHSVVDDQRLKEIFPHLPAEHRIGNQGQHSEDAHLVEPDHAFVLPGSHAHGSLGAPVCEVQVFEVLHRAADTYPDLAVRHSDFKSLDKSVEQIV